MYRKFKDYNGIVFTGCTDAKIAEEWLRESRKILRIMRCSDEEKVLLAEFSMKVEAQIWWDPWVRFMHVMEC